MVQWARVVQWAQMGGHVEIENISIDVKFLPLIDVTDYGGTVILELPPPPNKPPPPRTKNINYPPSPPTLINYLPSSLPTIFLYDIFCIVLLSGI